MKNLDKRYVNGRWEAMSGSDTMDVFNPANEEVIAKLTLGDDSDVDAAVAAAKAAFPSFSQTSPEERVELLGRIVGEYGKRLPDIASTISSEMGAPMYLANAAQAPSGLAHFATALEVLKTFKWVEERPNGTAVVKEPVGVCGFITPWNWPINQIACKVAPAIAAGCTMVLKPSEVAPLNAVIMAEILDAAGVPAGVFNLVHGDGAGVGSAISSHPDIDMVSFTGSTRAGRLVARNAADTIKRVTQELGGKSANVVLEDADLDKAVAGGVAQCMNNSGQSCNAPTRMLVPASRHEEAKQIAKAAAEKVKVGDPNQEGVTIGPVSSQLQYDRIQALIAKGIDEGAEVVTGGLGKPEGLNVGAYVRPTVFANVSNDMTIAREEIFGPVLCILPYESEDDAVAIANDTDYGLSGYVQSGDIAHARQVASKLRTGNVHINGAGPDFTAPFGGYKQSGNGREWGDHGFTEFLESKAVLGYADAS